MSNRYSNFPDSLDQLKLLPEVQEMTNVVKQKIVRYNELVLKVSLTAEEEIELQALINETRDFQLNSSDWNKTNGVLMETQRYIKENIMGDIGTLVDNGEIQIDNSVANAKLSIDTKVTQVKQDVTNTTNSAKSSIETTRTNANESINTVKAQTIFELNQKVADIVASGNIGIDYFKNRVVLTQNSQTVKVNIAEYNRSTDFLIVFINGLIGVEGINYTMDNDDITLRAVGGTWESGDEFDFIVLKRTVVIMDRYDAGLFADGTIRKEKLTVGLQEEISNATNDVVLIKKDIIKQVDDITTATDKKLLLKQEKEDTTLKTTNKTIVGSINELSDNKLNLSEKGKANGVATLDSEGLVTESQLYKFGDIKSAIFPPSSNWLKLDGSQISVSEYTELYHLFNAYYKDLIRDPKAITGLGRLETHQSGFPPAQPYNVYTKNGIVFYTFNSYQSTMYNDYRRHTYASGTVIESYEVGEKLSPYSFLYALNKWWAVNEDGVKTSTSPTSNLYNWTSISITKEAPLYKMYDFNNTLLITTKIYSEGVTSKFQIIKSTNGTTWEAKTFSFTDTDFQTYTNYYAKIVGYINNRYIVIINKKIYSVSNDFTTLTLLGSTVNSYELVAYQNTKDAIYYVDYNIVYKSVDGISFTKLGKQTNGVFTKVVHNGHSFVGVVNNNLYLSDDGVNFDKKIEMFEDRWDYVSFYPSGISFDSDTGELVVGIQIYNSGSYGHEGETMYKVRFNPDGKFNLPIYEESTYIKAR